jgi:hypothetical protein
MDLPATAGLKRAEGEYRDQGSQRVIADAGVCEKRIS